MSLCSICNFSHLNLLIWLNLFCVSVQENVAQMLLVPHLSNHHTSQNMEDQESPPEEEEEEEFIVLDSEHVCSFFFNIYAISINETNRFCLTAPQSERLYHVLSVCLVYCCTDNN